ncbi:LOW QUALITY PROTEIN: OPT oligopeptide transporter protein-domain-containing protein [Endogone sp. FLAS-F59071]|nr:LOW QUALITY PROTEIN: OPT oligopeptide transporter protein-domain-containing protein [Endogone sp. FLAS-F59071]|eukprot:RUS23336.1 LOW QUALITY PROTEIN: OPT oligopeptide transporter protein-domain-containing protein [Endogone sp. FLAS-F59071]
MSTAQLPLPAQELVARRRRRTLDWVVPVFLQHVLWATDRLDFDDVAAVLAAGLRRLQAFPGQAARRIWTHRERTTTNHGRGDGDDAAVRRFRGARARTRAANRGGPSRWAHQALGVAIDHLELRTCIFRSVLCCAATDADSALYKISSSAFRQIQIVFSSSYFIIREKLRFPSGTATAQMISILHEKSDPTTTAVSTAVSSASRGVRPVQPTESSSSTPPPLAASVKDDDDREEDWQIKWHALLYSFSLSSVYTLLTYFVPIMSKLPLFNWLTLGLVDFKAWDWYFTPSLSYMGQGIIMGLPTTLSMLLGCIIGWGILSPLAFYQGWAPGPINDWKTGSKGWILWISLSVMVTESVVSLGVVLVRLMIKVFRRKVNVVQNGGLRELQRTHYAPLPTQTNTAEEEIEEEREEEEEPFFETPLRRHRAYGEDEEDEEDAPPEQLVGTGVTVAGLAVSCVLCITAMTVLFGKETLPVYATVIAVIVAMLLSVLGVRALGETDLNPASGIAKISQVLFASIVPGVIVADLVAGGIAEADLKTGHLLHASPKAQFYGQLIGSFVSCFISTAAYVLYTTIYTIPGKEFPAPTAEVWLDMSRLVNGQPLPKHVPEFIFSFALVFTCLVLAKETSRASWTRFIPQGIAFAVGIYNPPNFTLARVIGGYVGWRWDQFCDEAEKTGGETEGRGRWTGVWLKWVAGYRKAGRVVIIVVASGFVLGEGTFAIVNLVMRACGVPHL